MDTQNIVVAVDFSEPSNRALRTAIEIARKERATLHIVHALELPTPIYSTYAFEVPGNYMAAARAEAQRLLEDAVKDATECGVTAQSHLCATPASTALADSARELGADLMVVGTHGHTGLKHFALGSVAERIIRHASCNVLVVRDKETAA